MVSLLRGALPIAVLLALLVPASASAAIDDVFDGEVECTVEGDGVRFCGSTSPRSTVPTFDGTPIDVHVAFPPEPGEGADGPYPLVMIFHGYGGGKIGLAGMRRWLEKGYATFSMTTRGFRESCGSGASRAADPDGCADGYVRLMDTRYEVRDAQELAGILADEGLVEPTRIGATGASYGGGTSLALASLRDRKMLLDGSLVPWTSPEGKAMRIAAATPWITWSDLAYALVPNGSTLDYLADSPYQGRFGVMKQSLVNGLYVSGQLAPGFYAPEGSDPSADLTGWRARLLEGEPYETDPMADELLTEATSFHSAYYIDHSRPPAPLLIANGFTDDLFPVSEMVRYYNRTRHEHPGADIAMIGADIAGHPRGQSKPEVLKALADRQDEWFDHFILGDGPAPRQGVEAYPQTCPADAPSTGPLRAENWARIAPGELRLRDASTKAIAPTGGSNQVAAAFNPVGGGGACAETDGADQPGTASYRLPPAPEPGYTLVGSPTVIADFALSGTTSQVAARLLDVGPDGTQRLVARGLWRPESSGRQVFQLHPNGWRFEPGHVAKLELLPADADGGTLGDYGRRSNGQQPVGVSKLRLRIPVAQRPGSLGGLVGLPAPRRVPEGLELASDFAELPSPRARLGKGRLRVRKGRVVGRVICPARFESCNRGRIRVRAARKRHGFAVANGRFGRAQGGERVRVRAKLKPRARRYFRSNRGLRVVSRVRSAETKGAARQERSLRR